MSTPDEHTKFQFAELNTLNKELETMKKWGVPETADAFKALLNARGAAMGKLGLRVPRITQLITKLIGLSPGDLKLFADAELGWLVEARTHPGAKSVFHYVADDIAEAIVKGELTHEIHDYLMAPDPYIGE